jgi:hypothetical protein
MCHTTQNGYTILFACDSSGNPSKKNIHIIGLICPNGHSITSGICMMEVMDNGIMCSSCTTAESSRNVSLDKKWKTSPIVCNRG